jgi:hypothetical protein
MIEGKRMIGTTVTIPQHLYERVQRIARRQYRDVNEVASEILEQSILPLENGLNTTPEREREKEAFHRLHGSLLKRYAGEYVAIYNGKMIDHDKDRTVLLNRIDTQYPDQFVLIRPVKSEPEIIYEHRSARWA